MGAQRPMMGDCSASDHLFCKIWIYIVMTIHDTLSRTTSSLCTWNQTKTIGTDSSCHLPSVLATAILLPECWMAPDCSWIVPTLFSPWWDHSKQAHGKTKAKTTNSTFLKPIVPHQYLLHHWQITFHACSNIGGKGLLRMESIASLCQSWLFLVSYTPQDHTSIRQSISYPIRKCCLQADPWHTKAALPSMCRIALFQLWQGLPRKLFSEGNNNVATTNTTSNRKATHLMTQDPSWENMPTIQRGNLEACQSVSIREFVAKYFIPLPPTTLKFSAHGSRHRFVPPVAKTHDFKVKVLWYARELWKHLLYP